MKKVFTIMISAFLGGLLLIGCGKTGQTQQDASSSEEAYSSQIQQDASSSEEAYASLLSGDNTLLEDEDLKKWGKPNFQVEGFEYEYTYLDLDGDGGVELLVQMVGDPGGYNAVFHFEDGKLFCWKADEVEQVCWDYPLNDGTMMQQYHYNGTRSYTIFRYKANGEKEQISSLFARDELVYLDS